VFLFGVLSKDALSGIAGANFLKDSSRTPELLVGQAARVGENGQRITDQRCAGEDIKLDELVSARGHNLKGMAVSNCGIEQVRIERTAKPFSPALVFPSEAVW